MTRDACEGNVTTTLNGGNHTLKLDSGNATMQCDGGSITLQAAQTITLKVAAIPSPSARAASR